MRQRTEIMENSGCDKINRTSGDPQSINMAIIVELMLDMRQVAAANFVIANGGSLTTPAWLKDIAAGK